MMSESILKNKSYWFAVEIVKTTKQLQIREKEFVLSRQLLKSGTSVGANIREAEYAQSDLDFISKMSISLKEANETIYWLDLLKDTDYIKMGEHNRLVNDITEILRMLISTINTMKNKQKNRKS